MQTILQKLFDEPAEDAFSAILATYKREGFTIINFLYFANIVAQTLFETQNKTEKEREYKKILLKSDFLFPDGIAMQLFYACAKLFRRIKTAHTRLPNLNGTDFIPYFLSEIKRTYGNQKLCLLLYGTKEQRLEKAKKKLSFQGYNVIYAQDGYSDFNREAAETAIAEYQDTINLLLVGRSTPKIPLQELWTSRNYQKIQENQLIVFNSGGLLDFIAEAQKRAPKRIRSVKLEWLYRVLTDPKRNRIKIRNSFQIFPYIWRYIIRTPKTPSTS